MDLDLWKLRLKYGAAGAVFVAGIWVLVHAWRVAHGP